MLGLCEAIRSWRLDPGAEQAVLTLAARLMWADPSHDARSAVREAVDRLTTPCVACGTRYADAHWTLAECDVCHEPVCEDCLARVRRDAPRLVVEIVICPRCLRASRTPAGAESVAYALAAKAGAVADVDQYVREVEMLGQHVDVAA